MDTSPYIHTRAVCESKNIGPGTRIWGQTHVLAGAQIGARCNICEQVFIENEVIIGDDCTVKNGVAIWDKITLEDGVFIGPNAVFTNDLRPRAFLKRGSAGFLPTIIRKGATIGANATIVCGIEIGEFAMIGAGAVVTKDVPPHHLVLGSPAKPAGLVCYCGEEISGGVVPDRCPHVWATKIPSYLMSREPKKTTTPPRGH